MTTPYYNPTGTPSAGSGGISSLIRAEFAAIAAGFALLPTLSGNANKAVVINGAASAITVTTGTLALAGNFATTGAFNTSLTQQATVTLTLPAVNGTLATLAGTETLTNKTLTAPTLTTPALGTPASGNLSNCVGNASGLTAGAVSGGAVNATTILGDSISVGGNANVGSLYTVGSTQVVGARKTGWTAGTGGTPNKGAIDYSTATLTQLANRVMAIEQALFATTGHGLIGT